MVYIIDKEGRPLMPTKRYGKVKWLLRRKQAKVVKRSPFTIQLLYEPQTHCTQPVTLGVDAGSKHVGLSASTEKEELFSAEMTLRDDIPQLMTARSQSRGTRRSRLRYRKPRFDNRRRYDGWLTPTMEAKVMAHENVIDDVYTILPVSRIVIETASFDIQKITGTISPVGTVAAMSTWKSTTSSSARMEAPTGRPTSSRCAKNATRTTTMERVHWTSPSLKTKASKARQRCRRCDGSSLTRSGPHIPISP